MYAVGHGPDLVVAETGSSDPDLGPALIRLGAGAAVVATDGAVRVVTADGEWSARVAADSPDVPYPPARGALVAGLVPGELLGWSWPDRLKHALALAAGGTDNAGRPGSWPGGEDRDHVDLAAYERLLDAVTVESLAANAGNP